MSDISQLGDRAVADLLALRPVVLLPVGAVESHGDHLPAGTDNILAGRLTDALVRAVGDAVPVLRLPTFAFGQVWSLADAPGSFGLSTETVRNAVVELACAAQDKGCAAMAVVNAHLGNAPAIRDAQRIMKGRAFTVANFFYPGASGPTAAVRERPEAHPAFMHACEIETSYMLHLAPEAVDMTRAVANYPAFPDDFATVAYRWTEFSDSPVLGDPRAATALKGRTILAAVVAEMARQVIALHARDRPAP